MSTSGKIIDGRGRDIVLKVHQYFEDERDNCKLMLLRLMALEKGVKDVKVPLRLFHDVLKYFKSTFQVARRVIAATQINKNSLTRIKKEGKEALANNTSLVTPMKKPRGKRKFFSDLKIRELKNILRNDYIEGKQDFKFKTLVNMVRNDMNYRGSLATLRRIIWDMGFRWKKQPGKMVAKLSEYPEKNKVNLSGSDNEQIDPEMNGKQESNEELYLEIESNLEDNENPVTVKVKHGLQSYSSAVENKVEYIMNAEYLEDFEESENELDN